MTVIRYMAVVAGVCLLSGCLSTRSYVDPKLHDLNWTAVKAPTQVHPVKIEVEFLRNGERYTRADRAARSAIERALQKSGVVTMNADAPAQFWVKVNNIADIGAAVKKGIGTGLTFGAKGSTVTDGYEITIRYERNGRTLEKAYQHALHSTVGNAKPMTPATPMSPAQAFDQVIEDAVIHFLRDAQSEGLLVIRSSRAQPQA